MILNKMKYLILILKLLKCIFESTRFQKLEMNHLEFGIEPDIHVNMTSEDMQKGLDTIIETARKHLKNIQK